MEKIKVNPYRSIATSEKQLLDAGENKNVMNDKKIKEIFDKKMAQKNSESENEISQKSHSQTAQMISMEY